MSTTSFANPVAIYLFQILSVAEAPRLSGGVLLAGGACSPCRGGRGRRVEAKALGFRRESWGRGGFQRSGFQSGPGFYVCGNGRKENTAELLGGSSCRTCWCPGE